MKAMKATKAMKAMKVMKKKAVAKTAKGRLAKALVLRGSKEKTTGGLKKDDLIKNIEAWVEAHMSARKALQVKGFCAINGKTLQGKAIYVKAKAILAGSARSSQAPAPSPARSPPPAPAPAPAVLAAEE